ncbi:uncharacterized protein LOC134529853 isoform X4 [Bacillus rossius redtenbacheri]|uniref:uncharacterized protein LOC134529853 isoform X4 n=1 Tax=Bacillus rossius redtenbacheri TaxID=93214 RepID=UPI002FDC8441
MQLTASALLSAAVVGIFLVETYGRPSDPQPQELRPLRREARENSGFYTAHQDAGISKPEHKTDEAFQFYGGARGQYLVNHPVYGLVSSVRLADLKDKATKDKEEQENENESEEEESETVEIQPPPKGASVAEAKPVGMAIAGEGGVAVSKPVATSVVGPGGLAIARPVATAIAGVRINEALLGGLGGDGGGEKPQKPQKPMASKGPGRHKQGMFPSHAALRAAQQYLYPVAYY